MLEKDLSNIFTLEIISRNKNMLDSFKNFLGYDLIKREKSNIQDAENLFNASFVVVSHGSEANPIFKYGNKKALELFEMNWNDFIQLPSKLSAEKIEQIERERLLNEVTKNGFIKNYSGIRISSTGKRFKISNAIVWNVFNENKKYIGQAATFNNWEYL